MKNKYKVSANRWWLVLVSMMSLALLAQGQTTQPPVIEWQRVVEANNSINVNGVNLTSAAVVKNNSGGYSVLTGDRRLLSLTASGDVITDTQIVSLAANGGVTTSLQVSGLAPTSDGGVVLGVKDNLNVWSLQKRDTQGALMWVSRIPGSNVNNSFYNVTDVVPSLDGGFVVFGDVGDRRGFNPTSVTANKFDRNGVLVWFKNIRYTFVGNTFVTQAISTLDGGYLLAGGTSPTSSRNDNVIGWASKLNDQGDVVWQNRYEEMNGFNAAAIYPLGKNGTYVLNGFNKANPSELTSSSLIIDGAGNQGDNKPVPVPFAAYTSNAAIATTPTAVEPLVYVVINETPTDANGGDIRLTGFSDQRTVVWTKTLGGSNRDYRDFGKAIIATDDGLIFVGITESTDGDVQGKTTTNTATWIVKLKNAASANALTLTQPTYNCQTGAITFNTSGGDGSVITYNAPGISRSSLTSNFGTVESGLRNDPKPITITATQSGQTVSFTFDLAAFCNGTQPPVNPPTPPAPPTGGSLALPQPTYDCQTGAITFNTTGGDGSPITYNAPGISRSSLTSNTGIIEQGLRNDPKPITITAMQNGVSVSYTFDLATYCANPQPPQPPQPPTGTALTLVAPSYDCGSGAITFRTSGGNGSPIEYAAAGITGWTTNPNQFVDRDSRTANDVEPFTLMARQNGVRVSYVWDLKAACGRARMGAGEEMATKLTLSVLGNPVSDATTVEIRGAAGKPLTLRLVDMSGKLLEQRVVEQPQEIERQRFELPQPGLLLLRASSAGQSQTVKILKM